MTFGRDLRSLVCICPIIILIIFLLTKGYNYSITHISTTDEHISNPINAKDSTCSWKFTKYVPSAWEVHWSSNIDTFQYKVCSILAQTDQLNRSIDVLRRIMSLQQSIAHSITDIVSVDIHLSQMHYHRTCFSKQDQVIQLIEPLIGLIRDPLTMCPRPSSMPSDLYLDGEYALQSKRHILLAPSSPYRIDPLFSLTVPSLAPWLYKEGRQKILIDIGCSYFKSRNGNTAEIGTRWFYDYFRNKSIAFDRIIAYEYQPLVTRRVWEELPDDVFPIYTFINVGVEATEMNKFNPWKMLESIATIDDYVIVKLDIDTPVLESALMKQLIDEKSQARRLIDELFFEKHVSANRQSKEDKLKDSYELFTKLRQAGVRMHGWP